jgi:hypothetical protein
MEPDVECETDTFDDAVETALRIVGSFADAGYGDENCCSVYNLDDSPDLAEIARVEVHGVTSNVALSIKYPQGWTDLSVEV